MPARKKKVSTKGQVAEKAVKVAVEVHRLLKIQAAAKGKSIGRHIAELVEKEPGA